MYSPEIILDDECMNIPYADSNPVFRPSLFAIWFHQQLAIQGKSIVALCLVAAMVLGSGCLTMTAIGAIEDKKEEKRRQKTLMVYRSSIENRSVEDFHQHMNERTFDAIPLYLDPANANSAKPQIGLLEKIKAVHFDIGNIGAWKMEDRRYQSEHHGLVTSMKLEITAEHGKYQEKLVWMFGDDNIMRLKDYTIHKQK